MMRFLAGNFYRHATNVPGVVYDFFACQAFRQIIYATWPVPKSAVLGDRMVFDSYDDMKHLTAHQVAYVDVKVSLCPFVCVAF